MLGNRRRCVIFRGCSNRSQMVDTCQLLKHSNFHSSPRNPRRIQNCPANTLNSCDSATAEKNRWPCRLSWFQLYAVKDCIALCLNQDILARFPAFIFFGSNGGLESIAFDLREGPPWRIVMVDQIAGTESAEEIAPNIAGFIEAIGMETEGQLT